jgi:hypothetical protein
MRRAAIFFLTGVCCVGIGGACASRSADVTVAFPAKSASTDGGYAECPELPGPCRVDWWPRACFENPKAATLFPDGRIWAPPVHCSDEGLSEEYRSYASWASSEPWPDGLRFVLVRAAWGPSYVVNIFEDGRTLLQTLTCGDRRIHSTYLSATQMRLLSGAVVAPYFMGATKCEDFVTDSAIVAVGWSDGHLRSVHYSNSSINGSTSSLAELIDGLVGSRRWLQ